MIGGYGRWTSSYWKMIKSYAIGYVIHKRAIRPNAAHAALARWGVKRKPFIYLYWRGESGIHHATLTRWRILITVFIVNVELLFQNCCTIIIRPYQYIGSPISTSRQYQVNVSNLMRTRSTRNSPFHSILTFFSPSSSNRRCWEQIIYLHSLPYKTRIPYNELLSLANWWSC